MATWMPYAVLLRRGFGSGDAPSGVVRGSATSFESTGAEGIRTLIAQHHGVPHRRFGMSPRPTFNKIRYRILP